MSTMALAAQGGSRGRGARITYPSPAVKDHAEAFRNLMADTVHVLGIACRPMPSPKFHIANLASERTVRSWDAIARGAAMVSLCGRVTRGDVEAALRDVVRFFVRAFAPDQCLKQLLIAESEVESLLNPKQSIALAAPSLSIEQLDELSHGIDRNIAVLTQLSDRVKHEKMLLCIRRPA